MFTQNGSNYTNISSIFAFKMGALLPNLIDHPVFLLTAKDLRFLVSANNNSGLLCLLRSSSPYPKVTVGCHNTHTTMEGLTTTYKLQLQADGVHGGDRSYLWQFLLKKNTFYRHAYYAAVLVLFMVMEILLRHARQLHPLQKRKHLSIISGDFFTISVVSCHPGNNAGS